MNLQELAFFKMTLIDKQRYFDLSTKYELPKNRIVEFYRQATEDIDREVILSENKDLKEIETSVNVYILKSMMRSWNKHKWDDFKETYPRLKQRVPYKYKDEDDKRASHADDRTHRLQSAFRTAASLEDENLERIAEVLVRDKDSFRQFYAREPKSSSRSKCSGSRCSIMGGKHKKTRKSKN
jgi:hypothetical protein